jgi:hypothetical protein
VRGGAGGQGVSAAGGGGWLAGRAAAAGRCGAAEAGGAPIQSHRTGGGSRLLGPVVRRGLAATCRGGLPSGLLPAARGGRWGII